ncbi:MAG: excinuclease ABC subunit UvrA, partial [Gammaproteobacteria bacterium]
NARGQKTERQHPFEGIITNIERRYHEADSPKLREELAQFMTHSTCPDCHGSRLNETARHVFLQHLNLPAINNMTIDRVLHSLETLSFSGHRKEIADKILTEICERLRFLTHVGLEYLSLSRSASTLSGGEAQRIRLASQIGAGLVGVLYVLDEPSIGLHQRDNARLLKTLERLRDLGNTIIIVEHDEDAIRQADHIIDMGPGAGVHGGHVVAQGSLEDIITTPDSITGQFLSGKRAITVPTQRNRVLDDRFISIRGASGNNLQSVNVSIPCGLFTCITGVSGSGKSTLITRTLYPLAAKLLNGATTLEPAPFEQVDGLASMDKVIDIDQSPIGRTPRSNPATYTGIFTPIRELFSATTEARSRGYKPGRFSFNVKGGRCEACQGDGLIKVEMHFIADMYVTCDICQGQRYNRETLEVRYKGKNIHEVLDMTIETAADFFAAVPSIANRLNTLLEVGLSYIRLGQAATTLSGGEAQRIKLAKELSRRDTGNTLYILDEPTTGLHFHDIHQLLKVLHALRDRGNTVVVIEHNLDVIKTADWIIDLGPEGGTKGGQIIATGTPETVASIAHSHTGRYLKPLLKR